jgi:hypothetical protein
MFAIVEEDTKGNAIAAMIFGRFFSFATMLENFPLRDVGTCPDEANAYGDRLFMFIPQGIFTV